MENGRLIICGRSARRPIGRSPNKAARKPRRVSPGRRPPPAINHQVAVAGRANLVLRSAPLVRRHICRPISRAQVAAERVPGAWRAAKGRPGSQACVTTNPAIK